MRSRCATQPIGGFSDRRYHGSMMSLGAADEANFSLYDLRVEVIHDGDSPIYCGAKGSDYFELRGEMLYLPPGQGFSIYSLGALLPLLAAKQRVTDPHDWMSSDAEVACPDPHCKTRFKIIRQGLRIFRRADTTAVPLPSDPQP